MNIFIAEIKEQAAILTPEESWHCAKVLRKKAGEEIALIDGKGSFYLGVLKVVNEKQCLAELQGTYTKQKSKGYKLHLAIAPTKQIDRMEWMVEKCVEIGIDEITFLLCAHSERAAVKAERIQKVVESAVKQSLQAFIPKVNPLVKFRDFMKSAKADHLLIAHCAPGEKMKLSSLAFSDKSILLLVGPEGDFSPDEIEAAKNMGFRSVSLGDNRLRTETAGLYATLALSILSEPKSPDGE